VLSFLQGYVTESQVSVNNIKCAILFWTEYLLFTFLFYVFLFWWLFCCEIPKTWIFTFNWFQKQHKKACSMGLIFSKNLTQFLSIFGSCITDLCKSCDSCYRMRKNINYEILLLHSSLKIMCVRACVCVCVYTHVRTQIMHASQLSVNFHYMLCCWLLRYIFTIFSHLILMSFLFQLCFNYSLLLNNADHHSTDSYTHLASETNSLWFHIFTIMHRIPCWFLGWVYWKIPWWQMNMKSWWIGNIP
jgi:hypothetical protein